MSFANKLEVKTLTWENGTTFLNYLENNEIPIRLYYNLDDDSQDLARMIFSGTRFNEARDENGKLVYSLIPVSEDTAIMIELDANNTYSFEAVGLYYETRKESVTFTLENSILYDLRKITGNSKLAIEMADIFNDIINFKNDLRKGDMVSIIYERKVRLGRTWGSPTVLAAYVETNKRKKFAFYNPADESYYNEKAKSIKGMFLKYPMAFRRISSRFSRGRMHPIYKKIRPHYGIDYVNKVGTPVKTVADGRVVYAGRKGGYGKTVIIQHKNGWRSLYAHLRGYSKRARRGKRVRQGNIIGYMGNTGLSTGPHLHFGMYKKNKPFNPAKIKSVRKSGLRGKAKKSYLSLASSLQEQLLDLSSQELFTINRFAQKDIK